MLKNKFLKILILSFMLFLSFSHVEQIINSGIKYNQLALILFAFLAIAIIKENSIFYSASFFMFAIGMILTLEDLTNISPAVIFLVAIYYKNNIITKSLSLTLIPICFLISYRIGEFNNYINLIEGIIGNIIFLMFLYLIFIKHLKKQYIINYLDFPSKKYLLDVMELYIQDKTWNEIAEKLTPQRTGNSLRKDTKKDITNLGFVSYGDFILYLGVNGIIKPIDKNTITE